ncbi:MAG: hypothetical protein HC884_13345 [Chloroflexaceae bacterium]|nr:hypothetical protein [Chloroflexaceae bacterium]
MPTRTRIILVLLLPLALGVPTGPTPAADDTWTSYGPPGGIIRTLAVDPTDPTTLYAATDGDGDRFTLADPDGNTASMLTTRRWCSTNF